MMQAALHHSLFLVLAAGVAWAAEPFNGPIAGYVAGEPGTEVRAILGVPGSFLFSDPLALPDGTTRIRMAPGRDLALIERGDQPPAALVWSAGAADRVIPLEGVMAAADWVAFSPGARSAMLFSSTANRLQVVTGLPDDPRIARDADAGVFPESLFTGAVSDDGRLVLAASSQSVYVLTGGAARLVLSGGRIASVAVLRNGKDAVVADRSAGSLQLLEDVAAAATPRTLAAGLDDAAQVMPAADGKTVFVTRPGSLAISWVDLASGEVRSADTAVEPAMLRPLRDRDTFLISAEPGQPGCIFYRDRSGARAVFIPAAAKNEAEQ